MTKNENKKQKTKLPRGVRLIGKSLVVDASIMVVRVSLHLILFVRTPKNNSTTARRPVNVTGWAACPCDKSGKCKIVFAPSMDPSKVTFNCESGTCTGTCTPSAGTAVGRGLSFLV